MAAPLRWRRPRTDPPDLPHRLSLRRLPHQELIHSPAARSVITYPRGGAVGPCGHEFLSKLSPGLAASPAEPFARVQQGSPNPPAMKIQPVVITGRIKLGRFDPGYCGHHEKDATRLQSLLRQKACGPLRLLPSPVFRSTFAGKLTFCFPCVPWARFSLPLFASLRVFRGQSLFSTTGFQRARLGFLLRQRFAIACPPFPSPPTSSASATSAISTTSPPLARPCERVPLTTGLHAATLRLSFLRDEHDRNPRAVARTHCGEPRDGPLALGCHRLRLASVGRGTTSDPSSGNSLSSKPRSHRFVVGRRV